MKHAAWIGYAQDGYHTDLAIFMRSSTLRGDNHYTLRQASYLVVCDANPHRFVEAVRNVPLVNRDRFVIGLTLDAILLAATHAYHRQCFATYSAALSVIVHVEAHPWAGVKRPHVLLTAVSSWCSTTLDLLSEGCAALLPKWAMLYDRLVGHTRAGARIVRSLTTDPDLAANPYHLLPLATMRSLHTGFSEAVRVIG